MNSKRSWLISEELSLERGFADMAFDLFTSLFTMGIRFALVLGVMLLILSLGRDAWSVLSGHE